MALVSLFVVIVKCPCSTQPTRLYYMEGLNATKLKVCTGGIDYANDNCARSF